MRDRVQSLERRARDVRARALVRSWEYRQRAHARGAWFDLRRVLADARAAFVVSDDTANELVRLGARLQPAGARVVPAKKILFVTAEELRAAGGGREIPVNLGQDFLAATNVALIPFSAT